MTKDEIAAAARHWSRMLEDRILKRDELSADDATLTRDLLTLANAVDALDQPAPELPLPRRLPDHLFSIDELTKTGGAGEDVRSLEDEGQLFGVVVGSTPGPRRFEGALIGRGGYMVGQPAPSLRTLAAVVAWPVSAGYQKLIGCGSSGNMFLGWNMGVHADGRLELRVGQGEASNKAAFLPCRPGHPMLVVARFDPSVMRLWAADRNQSVAIDNLPIFLGPLVLFAGHWDGRDGADPTRATLHALHAYDRAITDEEVEQLVEHYEPVTGPRGGWWEIEEPPAPEPPKPKPNGRPEVRVRPEDPFSMIQNAPSGSRVIVEGPREMRGHHLDLRNPDVEIEVPERDVVMVGGGIDRAITLAAKDVRITGLGIRDYRPRQYQHAAIEPRDFNHPDEADGFELTDSRIEDIAHGRALSGVMNMRVRGCTILRIGAVGIGGDYGGAVIEDTEVGWCNLAGHNTWVEAANITSKGGLGFNKGNVYRRLKLHDCDGRGGIWFDWDVVDALVEECDIWNISREGIAVEASARVKLLNNRLALCASAMQGMWDGTIMFQNSKDCEARGNLVVVEHGFAFSVGFQRRGRGSQPPQQSGRHHVGRFDGVRDVMVDNRVVLLGGDAQGFSWLYDGATATEPAVEGWTRQGAFDSHEWGPNAWHLGPGAAKHPFDGSGSTRPYSDAWEAVPADFRSLLIGR